MVAFVFSGRFGEKQRPIVFFSFASFGASPLFFFFWSGGHSRVRVRVPERLAFTPPMTTRWPGFQDRPTARPSAIRVQRETMTLGGPLADSPFHLLARGVLLLLPLFSPIGRTCSKRVCSKLTLPSLFPFDSFFHCLSRHPLCAFACRAVSLLPRLAFVFAHNTCPPPLFSRGSPCRIANHLVARL